MQVAIAGDTLEEGTRQQRDVFDALVKRGHSDREGADAVIQIAAESLLFHHVRHVPVRGTHQPEIGAQGFDSADAPVGAGFEQAQKLHLQRQRNVADLVEEQRAAAGGFDQPDLAMRRPGERSFFVAEQFAFEQGFGQARAVDGDEGPACAAAGLMYHSRHKLLSGARLAQQQHHGIGRRHPHHQ